jgi:hypothetical protein
MRVLAVFSGCFIRSIQLAGGTRKFVAVLDKYSWNRGDAILIGIAANTAMHPSENGAKIVMHTATSQMVPKNALSDVARANPIS